MAGIVDTAAELTPQWFSDALGVPVTAVEHAVRRRADGVAVAGAPEL